MQKTAALCGNKTVVAYFYFKHMHEDKRNLNDMMRSILSQVIDQDPSLLDYVYKRICETSRVSSEQVKELVQIVIRSARLCFLVVDGLDECVRDESSRTSEAEKVIKWLVELTATSPNAQASDFRVLISSQRDGVIEEKLKVYPTLQLEKLQPHDDDIERYVRMQAREISDTFPDSEATNEHKIVEKVTTAARGKYLHSITLQVLVTRLPSQGMFLYAKVVLENLLDQTSVFDFETELQDNNFPKELEQA